MAGKFVICCLRPHGVSDSMPNGMYGKLPGVYCHRETFILLFLCHLVFEIIKKKMFTYDKSFGKMKKKK